MITQFGDINIGGHTRITAPHISIFYERCHYTASISRSSHNFAKSLYLVFPRISIRADFIVIG